VKYGEWKLVDSMAFDALTCAFDQKAMGESTESYNARYGLTRQEQDEFSARSHQLAARAAKDGLFDDEIVPVEIPQRRGCVDRVIRMKGKDDTERAVNLARLVRLAARRCKSGAIHARTKRSELSSGRVRDGDPPDDPREGFEG
jgi:acetyl-CoA C-acetyltransferase